MRKTDERYFFLKSKFRCRLSHAVRVRIQEYFSLNPEIERYYRNRLWVSTGEDYSLLQESLENLRINQSRVHWKNYHKRVSLWKDEWDDPKLLLRCLFQEEFRKIYELHSAILDFRLTLDGKSVELICNTVFFPLSESGKRIRGRIHYSEFVGVLKKLVDMAEKLSNVAIITSGCIEISYSDSKAIIRAKKLNSLSSEIRWHIMDILWNEDSPARMKNVKDYYASYRKNLINPDLRESRIKNVGITMEKKGYKYISLKEISKRYHEYFPELRDGKYHYVRMKSIQEKVARERKQIRDKLREKEKRKKLSLSNPRCIKR